MRGDDGHVAILHLDDVLEVTKRRDVHSMDPELVELAGAFMGAGRPLIPLMLDGEDHTKYRKLLDPLFAPKVVAQLATRVRALADELIDGFVADGRVELYNTFCEPLPSMVFLTLLGLPLDDLDFLIWFKNGIIRPTDDDHRLTANTKMIEYLYAELDRREASGEPGDDLIGGFITAEVDGETLTREDVIDITFLLVLAGLDTVAASLSCIVDWLARHPDQRQRILDDPAILPAAIEELMRFETPVVAGGRYATADFEIGGEQVRAGDQLTVCWAAANLDDAGFDDPLDGRLRPRRQAAHRVRQRVPPLPRLAPGAHGAHRDPRCAARADPRLRARSRARAGLQQRHDPHRRPAAAGVQPPADAREERQQHREVGVDVAAPQVVSGVGDGRELDRRERRLPLRGELVVHQRALPAAADRPARDTGSRSGAPTGGPRGPRRRSGAPRAPTSDRR